MLVIGFILLGVVCILVKLFDEEIRQSHWRKVSINITCIAGILFLIIGFISIFIK